MAHIPAQKKTSPFLINNLVPYKKTSPFLINNLVQKFEGQVQTVLLGYPFVPSPAAAPKLQTIRAKALSLQAWWAAMARLFVAALVLVLAVPGALSIPGLEMVHGFAWRLARASLGEYATEVAAGLARGMLEGVASLAQSLARGVLAPPGLSEPPGSSEHPPELAALPPPMWPASVTTALMVVGASVVTWKTTRVLWTVLSTLGRFAAVAALLHFCCCCCGRRREKPAAKAREHKLQHEPPEVAPEPTPARREQALQLQLNPTAPPGADTTPCVRTGRYVGQPYHVAVGDAAYLKHVRSHAAKNPRPGIRALLAYADWLEQWHTPAVQAGKNA